MLDSFLCVNNGVISSVRAAKLIRCEGKDLSETGVYTQEMKWSKHIMVPYHAHRITAEREELLSRHFSSGAPCPLTTCMLPMRRDEPRGPRAG